MNFSQITLGELLAHPSVEVRRHASGVRKALERHEAKITAEQDNRMNPNAPRCKACGLHPAACHCLPIDDQ